MPQTCFTKTFQVLAILSTNIAIHVQLLITQILISWSNTHSLEMVLAV